MINLFQKGQEPSYLESKLEKIEQCMLANKEYEASIDLYLERLEEKMAQLEEMIQKKRQKRMNMMTLKYLEASPYIEMYKFDTVIHPKPKIICFLTMLHKSPRFKNKSAAYEIDYEKMITLSTSSEDTSAFGDGDDDDLEDFENFNEALTHKSSESLKKDFRKSLKKRKPFGGYSSLAGAIGPKAEENGDKTVGIASEKKHFEAKILEVIEAKGITPKTVKSFDFVSLAKKINTVSFLMLAERPVYGLDIYKVYRKKWGLDDGVRAWREQNDAALRALVGKFGSKHWAQLSNFVEGKNTNQCFHRWFKVLNSKRSKKRWSSNDDIVLVLGVLLYRKANGKIDKKPIFSIF